jgi:hypothetical protein
MASPVAMANLPLQITVGVLSASYWRGAWYILDYTLFPTDRLQSGIASLVLGSGLLGFKQYTLTPAYNGTKLLVRMLPPPRNLSLRAHYMKTNRFVSLYGIALGCVLVWRGTWLLWDETTDRISDALVESEPRAPVLLPAQQPPLLSPQAKVVHASLREDKHHHYNQVHDAVTHHDIDKTLFYSGIASHVLATVGLLLIGRFKSVMAPPANVSVMKDIFLHGKGKEFSRAAQSFARTR